MLNNTLFTWLSTLHPNTCLWRLFKCHRPVVASISQLIRRRESIAFFSFYLFYRRIWLEYHGFQPALPQSISVGFSASLCLKVRLCRLSTVDNSTIEVSPAPEEISLSFLKEIGQQTIPDMHGFLECEGPFAYATDIAQLLRATTG